LNAMGAEKYSKTMDSILKLWFDFLNALDYLFFRYFL
jgi:hypothetical protein